MWHVAQMFSYLEFNEAERIEVASILIDFIKNSDSRIVKVNSLQTLADLANIDERLRDKTIELIREQIKTGSPSLVSRGKNLNHKWIIRNANKHPE